MSKRMIPLLLVALLTLSALGSFSACNKDVDDDPYRPLYDEKGLYLEENFVYNAALDKENGVELFANGSCRYSVIYAETNDVAINAALTDLKTALDLYAGNVPLMTDSATESEYEIVVGNTNRSFTPEKPLVKTGAYVVATIGQKVFIYAENTYGITNGIYGFMEDYLGCMFFDATTTYYAPLTRLVLPSIYDVQEPAFDRRDVGDNEMYNAAFTRKLRVRPDESFDNNGGHNSLNMIPANVIRDHPEYLAVVVDPMAKIYQAAQGTQLCFSNPDVIDLLEEAILDKASLSTAPDHITVWWDISQADSMVYCECDECSRLAREHGDNPAAALYLCVNEIARRNPELHFSTFAYQYGSTPPTGIEFPENVMIKWCVMASLGRNDFSAPLYEKKSAVAEQEYNELVGWGKLTDTIFVWDYVTNYFYYMIPFPCLDAMAGNIRLYRDNSVQGIFVESAYNARASQDRLKANLAAHLLWDPDIDYKRFIAKFVTLYFGKEAAPHILNIYNRMQQTVSSPLCIYDFPYVHGNDYLSEANVTYYFAELEAAFSKTSDAEVLSRLRFEKATILYAAIEREYYGSEWQSAARAEFYRICQEFGITNLDELGSRQASDFNDN